jgi:response regulator RpfG family c-di-GMP phosphodiesterase
MYRIILVDDEINILSSLKRALLTIPFDDLDGDRPEIETFISARQALARIAGKPVDLVISDFRMPEMSGVEFLAEVIRVQPDIARLVLSGQADLEAVIDAINRVQIHRFIGKPWHDFELKSAVIQALAARALVLENRRLADLVRVQYAKISRRDAELRRLELESPGITHLELTADGRILIDDENNESY